MGAIASLVAGILGKLIAPLFELLKTWGVYRAGQKQGEAQSDLRHANEGAKTQRRMNDADARGPRTGDDAANRMRDGTF